MKSHRAAVLFFVALLAAPTLGRSNAQAQGIPSPEEFFGHQMGADRQLVRWDRLVEYYDTLGVLSDRLVVDHVGPSTLGNPFLVIYASSPQNLARLDDIQRMNAVVSDPRGHTQAQIDGAIENSKVVFVQSYALHSTEVAASQSAAEILYLFATRDDEVMDEILDETVSILIPAFNPDGNIIVTDWYDRWVGTEYEGSSPPELYHHYIGHDNNRDAFMQNTVESRYGAEIMFREWVPQAFIDHHQMGPYTARISLPPYAEPIRPEGDPLVWREMAWYGSHMALKMDENNLPGSIGAAIYSGWGHFGFHWITPFHNIAGMLTESASARLATPLYVHPDQLGGSRQLPEYAEQTTFPSPWEGGWWHVRDIVERQIVATFAPLELAAKNRETVLRNAYNKASRQTQRGIEGDTKAYVIPSSQHDVLTMQKMVNKLLGQGITVDRATRDFEHEGRVYQRGSYIVSMAQPKRGLIRWLLGQTHYPDNSYTRTRDGDPIRPYDMSTDNIAEFMGVRVDPVGSAVVAAMTRVTREIDASGTVSAGSFGYVLDGRLNDSFEAANRLFAAGAEVHRVHEDGAGLRAGDFVVSAGSDVEAIREIAEETGVDFTALNSDPAGVTYPLSAQRIGMYQRYYGGNMDEGWTRWLLEDFAFEYTSIMDEELLRGSLHERWDVIVLPSDSKQMMVGGGERGGANSVPPEYRSGFGEEGVQALRDFVENGGTLVTFAQAGDLVLDEFGVSVRDAVDGLSSNDFWSPGSSLHIDVDNTDPLAYGMPTRALAIFLAAIVAVEQGEGTIVMLGFRAQHRAQTHGTYKFFFNALMNRGGSAEEIAAGGSD
jgi:hypothetical protein